MRISDETLRRSLRIFTLKALGGTCVHSVGTMLRRYCRAGGSLKEPVSFPPESPLYGKKASFPHYAMLYGTVQQLEEVIAVYKENRTRVYLYDRDDEHTEHLTLFNCWVRYGRPEHGAVVHTVRDICDSSALRLTREWNSTVSRALELRPPLDTDVRAAIMAQIAEGPVAEIPVLWNQGAAFYNEAGYSKRSGVITETPLKEAVAYRNVDVARRLLLAGADPFYKKYDHYRTAYEDMVSNGLEELLALIPTPKEDHAKYHAMAACGGHRDVAARFTPDKYVDAHVYAMAGWAEPFTDELVASMDAEDTLRALQYGHVDLYRDLIRRGAPEHEYATAWAEVMDATL